MKFTAEGHKYDVDLSDLSVGEARLIKRHADMGLREFFDGIKAYDVDAFLALVLIAKKRNNEAVTWGDLGDLDFMEIANSYARAEIEALQEAFDKALAESTDEGESGEGSPDPTGPPKKRAAKKKTSGKTRSSG